MRFAMKAAPCALMLAAAVGCGVQDSVYYGTMERLGWHKRDLLTGRVEAARDAQEEAKEEFQSALEEFSAVTEFEGGELGEVYRTLNRALERSEARATAVEERIDEVERVAQALFSEWQTELDQFDNRELARASEQRLDATRQRYEDLYRAMRRAQSKIEPVLTPMRDQVLFLKHNLNARAIASIKGELSAIEIDVALLIEDMEAAMMEADDFVEQMNQPVEIVPEPQPVPQAQG